MNHETRKNCNDEAVFVVFECSNERYQINFQNDPRDGHPRT